jgi:hypothetical protein
MNDRGCRDDQIGIANDAALAPEVSVEIGGKDDDLFRDRQYAARKAARIREPVFSESATVEYPPRTMTGARTYGRLSLIVGISLAVALTAACAPTSRARLEQPHLQGPQRELNLVSEQTWWAPGNDVIRVLSEFPLPGASTGRPTYVLYLRLNETAAQPVGDGKFQEWSARAGLRGFLIQTRGRQAGLTSLVGGRVTAQPPPSGLTAGWTLQLDLDFEDGSRFSAALAAQRQERAVRQFETLRRPADVAALLSPPRPESQADQ